MAHETETTLQWFPGHMAKAKRTLRRYVEFADIILHTIDARSPASSASTLSRQFSSPARKLAVILTKCDLADPKKTGLWDKWLRDQGFAVFKSSLTAIPAELKAVLAGKSQNAPVHAIVSGLPNVGKSTLINRLIGKKKAKTGALPGLTRGPQWIKLDARFYLLDTPGIFFPENIPMDKAWRLAAIAVIPEKNYSNQIVEICEHLVKYVQAHYHTFNESIADFHAFLREMGRKRGVISKGGEVNLEDTAKRLIADFQKGKWGRITLETPGG